MRHKLAIALLLGVLAAPAYSGEHWVTTGFLSHHAKGEYRENNYGIGYEFHKDGRSYHVGYYRNSLDRDSVYAAVGFRIFDLGRSATLGVIVGAASGYNLAITPIALPVIEWTPTKSFGINFIAIPPIPNVTPFTAAIQFKWRFK